MYFPVWYGWMHWRQPPRSLGERQESVHLCWYSWWDTRCWVDAVCQQHGARSANQDASPFHSITFNGATCGVDDSGTTACEDSQGRGFILSPAWSGWLPKV